MMHIQCTQVGKRFSRRPHTWMSDRLLGHPRDQFWALEDITLTIAGPGRRVGVVGANGSGKTTLLRLIAGVTTPTCGQLVVHGRVVSLLELLAGMEGDLTGRENIELNGVMLGMRRREIRRQLDAIVAFAGIEPFLDMPLKHYSLGMRMRLGFGVAVHVPSDILLVDEAWSISDTAFQAKSFEQLHQLQRQGVTTLVVSHDEGVLRRLTETGIWLQAGRLAAEGPTESVLAAYRAASVSKGD